MPHFKQKVFLTNISSKNILNFKLKQLDIVRSNPHIEQINIDFIKLIKTKIIEASLNGFFMQTESESLFIHSDIGSFQHELFKTFNKYHYRYHLTGKEKNWCSDSNIGDVRKDTLFLYEELKKCRVKTNREYSFIRLESYSKEDPNIFKKFFYDKMQVLQNFTRNEQQFLILINFLGFIEDEKKPLEDMENPDLLFIYTLNKFYIQKVCSYILYT